MIEQLLDYSPYYGPILLLSGVLFWLLRNKYGGGLNDIPGPFLAGFTNLRRLYVARGRRPETDHIRLHEKYGTLVRLGPRVVSVADPEAIKVIYGLNAGFVKVRAPTLRGSV